MSLVFLSVLFAGCGNNVDDISKKSVERTTQSSVDLKLVENQDIKKNDEAKNGSNAQESQEKKESVNKKVQEETKKESSNKHIEEKKTEKKKTEEKKSAYKKPSRNFYISVGDSTRAAYGQYVYKTVSKKLHKLGYRTKLMAKSGYQLRQFTQGDGYPSVYDVIDSIDGDGSRVIVNISLGINDYGKSKYEIKELLKSAIRKIKDEKPKTLIVLTTPNKLLHNSSHTHDIDAAYSEVSSELGLKLIWAGHDFDSNYYNSDGVHPNESGQKRVASSVLSGLSLGRVSENDDGEDWQQWENDSDEDWHQWDD